jgi:hypothetical protein
LPEDTLAELSVAADSWLGEQRRRAADCCWHLTELDSILLVPDMTRAAGSEWHNNPCVTRCSALADMPTAIDCYHKSWS